MGTTRVVLIHDDQTVEVVQPRRESKIDEAQERLLDEILRTHARIEKADAKIFSQGYLQGLAWVWVSIFDRNLPALDTLTALAKERGLL